MNQQSDNNFKIIIFQSTHAQKIADFQINMAKQTQNLDLIPELVNQATSYLSKHHELGFYLVKLHNQTPLGSLLLTFQNAQSWWIQSVYVQKDYRRKGHFKSVFYQACKVAKQRGAHSLKLYAQSENQKAKQTYRSLGMFSNGQKFYTYDFVYGKIKLEDAKNIGINHIFLIEPSSQKEKEQFKGHDLLTNQNSKNKMLKISREGQVMSIISYFTEFSEWRFGLIYYIDTIFLIKQLTKEEINLIHKYLCIYFSENSEIKVGAIRYIFTSKSQKIYEILDDGQIEHYDVMEIKF